MLMTLAAISWSAGAISEHNGSLLPKPRLGNVWGPGRRRQRPVAAIGPVPMEHLYLLKVAGF